MNVAWSPHARSLLADILNEIRFELSLQDAARWKNRIDVSVLQLADFPLLGTSIPPVCFQTIPDNADRLRQIICKPYRIVYEPAEDEIHILSIRHVRMLVAEGDTTWH